MSEYLEKKPHIVFDTSKPDEVGIYYPEEVTLKAKKGNMINAEIKFKASDINTVGEIAQLRRMVDNYTGHLHLIFVRHFSLTKDDYSFYDCRDIRVSMPVYSKTAIAVVFECTISFNAIYCEKEYKKTGTIRVVVRKGGDDIFESLDGNTITSMSSYDVDTI